MITDPINSTARHREAALDMPAPGPQVSAQAASSSVFVSGGRPFVMWVCGVALAYDFIAEPVLRFVSQVIFSYTGAFPVINTDALSTILMGILGLGAMRTIERMAGRA